MDVNAELARAILLRESGKPEEALELLKNLLKQNPDDSVANYQAAWACDRMGDEAQAVGYYEAAVANGLRGEDLRGALLGLGSSYRCLGRIEESLAVFDKAIAKFPEDNALRAFRALTLHSLGKSAASVSALMELLLETTGDEDILRFKKALSYYASTLE